MTREMINLIKSRKQEAAEMIRFANPKSRTRPTMERVIEILTAKIPYRHDESRPEITNVEVTKYSANRIIKCATFKVTLVNGKVWEIDTCQYLTGRTPEEREADKTADFPSGLFRFWHKEITETIKGDGEPVPTETQIVTLTREETKTGYSYYLNDKVNHNRLYRGKNYTHYLKNIYSTKIPVYFNQYLFPQFSEIPMKFIDDDVEGMRWEMLHEYRQLPGGASALYEIVKGAA